MEQVTEKISCPNCGEDINVNDILYRKLDDELKQKYNDQLAKDRRALVDREENIERERVDLERQKIEQDKNIKEAIRIGIQQQESQLKTGWKKEIQEKIQEEQGGRIAALEKELDHKTVQVKELNISKAEVAKLKRERDELEEKMELELQQKISETLREEKEKIQKNEAERSRLVVSERDQVINQLREQVHEMQRKAEQGSTQLQGEVQELAIEEWLSAQFPLDTISEIKKGERGADCLHIVHTRTRQNCGKIYYESKRTKSFQPSWIEKFRQDIRDKNASIGVLVTEAMPKGVDHCALIEGVWVCPFEEFKWLCAVLRESVIQVSAVVSAQENRGDKMGMLYDFLTGREFQRQVEAIVEGFVHMKSDLEREKRSIQGSWSKREKQIEKVLLNTSAMYNSIKGIAGNAIRPVSLLELPPEDGELAEIAH